MNGSALRCQSDRRSSFDTRHPFHGQGYDFDVRLYPRRSRHGGYRHGLCSHRPRPRRGRLQLVREEQEKLRAKPASPKCRTRCGEDGFYFEHVPIFGGDKPKRVIDDKGKFGDANDAVIQALIDANALIARGGCGINIRIHGGRKRRSSSATRRNGSSRSTSRPRSRASRAQKTIRDVALQAIEDTRFVPASGRTACAA